MEMILGTMNFQTLALNGVVAVLIIKEVLSFILKFLNKNKVSPEVASMQSSIQDLVESGKKAREEEQELRKKEQELHEKRHEKIVERLRDLKDKNDDLHEWHSKTDADGVKVWYVRQSLEQAVVKLSDNISIQTEVLKDLLKESRDTNRTVEKLQEEMIEIKAKQSNRSAQKRTAQKKQ